MPAKNLFKMMACIALASSCVFVEAAREPVDYVNTGIGSISHMLVPTFRTVQSGFPVRVYLHAEFDVAPSDVRKTGARTVVFFGAKAETVRMRVGISYVSAS